MQHILILLGEHIERNGLQPRLILSVCSTRGTTVGRGTALDCRNCSSNPFSCRCDCLPRQAEDKGNEKYIMLSCTPISMMAA
jgi:hypothetical protein